MHQPPPLPSLPWVLPDGKPTQGFSQWVAAVTAAALGPLKSAANDVAAAAAGVPIGGLYANGNVVQVRLT